MSRRMSCAITVDAVRARTKTVTRRHEKTWSNLEPGDRLTLIEKGMGLPKGSKQVVLAEVVIVSNTVEPLVAITEADCVAEGFAHLSPAQFCGMWMDSHNMPNFGSLGEAERYLVRRIEWRYLDEQG